MLGNIDLKRRLAYLVLGQRGGQNRVQIIQALKERPYNLNQLAELLKLNYRTIKHHVDTLLKSEIINTSSTSAYGQVYFLAPELENNFNLLEEVTQMLNGITASPKLFQNVIEQTNDAVVIIDPHLEVLFWNDSAVTLFGYGQEEAIGRKIAVFGETSQLEKELASISEGKKVPRIKTQLVSKNGNYIEADVTIDGIRDDQEKIVSFSMIILDMTEQTRAIEALKVSEQRYALAQRSAGIISWEWDLATDEMTWSENPEVVLGKGVKVHSFKQFLKCIHPDDRDEVQRAAKAATKSSKVGSVQNRILWSDGSVHWVSQSGSVMKDKKGKPVRMLGIMQDITDRLEVERKYSTILDTTNDGFFVTDMVGRFVEVNSAFCKITGYSRRELLLMAIKDIEERESSSETAQHLKMVMENGYDSFETRHRRKDGSIIDLAISVSFMSVEEGRFIVFSRDITERKKAEAALRSSEQRFALAQKAADMGSWEWDIITGGLKWSDTIEPMFGFSKGKFKGTYEAFLECVHPEDRKHVEDSVNDAVERKRPYDIEHRIIWPDGSVHWMSEKGEVFRDAQGKPLRMLGIVQDITKRHELGLKYETILRTAPDAIEITDTDGNLLEVNDALDRMLGYSANELKSMSVFDIRQGRREDIARHFKTIVEKGSDRFETVDRRKDGELIDVEISARFLDIAEGRIVNVVRDITERKKVEGAIRRAKVEWERTFDSVPDLIAILDTKYKIVRANKAMAKRLGKSPEDCIGLTCFACVHGTKRPPDYCPHSKTIKDRKEHMVEVHEEKMGGYFLVSTTPLIDERGEFIGSVHVARNITERKKAEQQAIYLASFPGQNSNPILEFDLEGNAIYQNEAAGQALKAAGLDDPQAFLTNEPRALIAELKGKQKALAPREVQVGERTYLATFSPVPAGDRIRIYSIDVTDRRHIEKALEDSEKKYRLLFEKIGAGLVLYDVITDKKGGPVDLRIVNVNPAYEEMMGLRAAKIVGKTVREALPWAEDEIIRTFGMVGLTGKGVHLERKVAALGRDFDLIAYSPKKGQVALVFTDITERKKAEEELRRNKEQLEKLLKERAAGPGK